MLHPLSSRVVKKMIHGIIAPHGMTDLIHAQQNNLLKELYTINLTSVVSSLGFNYFHLDNILLGLFFISSIIHFRHDMPEIKHIPRFLLSAFFIFFSLFISKELLLFYMLIIHVPHHYMMHNNYLKKEGMKSFLTILIPTFLFLFIGEELEYSRLVVNLGEGIVISHILYEELFIHKNKFIKDRKLEI